MSARRRDVETRSPDVRVYTLEDFPFWVPQTWECIGVAGMKRRGKSALLKRWCRFLMRELKRAYPGWGIVVCDAHDEYSVLGLERDDCQLGPLPQRRTMADLVVDAEEDPEVLHRPDLALAVAPDSLDMDRTQMAAGYRSVMHLLRKRGRVIVIFEELGFWGEHAEESLHTVAACWGKDGVVPVYCGQAVTDTPASVRRQWSCLVSAQQVKRSDLDFIKGQAGGRIAAAIAQLEPKQYVRADLNEPAPEVLASLSP